MQVLFIHQVFLSPQEAGSTRHFELAKHLVQKGNNITIIGSTVSYLTGKAEEKYKGKIFYKEEIEGVNFRYADLDRMQKRYDPSRLKDGMNVTADGENIFYISNPAVGLWAYRERFKD